MGCIANLPVKATLTHIMPLRTRLRLRQQRILREPLRCRTIRIDQRLKTNCQLMTTRNRQLLPTHRMILINLRKQPLRILTPDVPIRMLVVLRWPGPAILLPLLRPHLSQLLLQPLLLIVQRPLTPMTPR